MIVTGRPVVRDEATISVIVSRLLQADDNNRINKRIAPILRSKRSSVNAVAYEKRVIQMPSAWHLLLLHNRPPDIEEHGDGPGRGRDGKELN